MNQTVATLGSIGEFVGAIAVVITLVFLTIQIRLSRKSMEENTQQLRNASLSQHIQLIGDFRARVYSDPILADLWFGGLDENADDLRRFTYSQMAIDYIQRTRTSYIAARDAGHEGQMAMVCANLTNEMSRSPSFEIHWGAGGREYSMLVDPEFVETIDQAIEERDRNLA